MPQNQKLPTSPASTPVTQRRSAAPLIDQSGSNENQPGGYTVDEAIETIGFGRFQIKLTLIASLGWWRQYSLIAQDDNSKCDGAQHSSQHTPMARAMDFAAFTLLMPAIKGDWMTNKWEDSQITIIQVVGSMCTASLWGVVMDKYGRRKGILLTFGMCLYFNVLLAFSPNLIWLSIASFLFGVGNASIGQIVSYAAEFSPSKTRGKVAAVIWVGWSAGMTLMFVVAVLLVSRFNWRYLFVSAQILKIPFFALMLNAPESPRYLIVRGEVAEASRILDQVARENNSYTPIGQLTLSTTCVEKDSVSEMGIVQQLIKHNLLITTGLLALLWFSAYLLFYGGQLLIPMWFQGYSVCGVTFRELGGGEDCRLGRKDMLKENYFYTLLTTAGEVPFVMLTLLLVDRVGRRKTMLVGSIICTLAAPALVVCLNKYSALALWTLIRSASVVAFMTLLVYTSELYPTTFRATIIGFMSSVGRVGYLSSGFLAGVLLESSPTAVIIIVTALSALSAVSAVILPHETKDKGLKDTLDE